MNIKDMRVKAGLTQKNLSEQYHIPLQTLKQWESKENSQSHRRPPDYVAFMLGRLLQHDFDVCFGPLDRAENLIVAAEHSKGSARQWLRYLRKEFDGRTLKLTDKQIKTVLKSEHLSVLQKVILKRVAEEGTATNAYVIALNSKAKTPMLDKLIGEKND